MRRRELLLLSAAITAPRSVSAQHRGSALVGVLDPTPGPHQSTLGSFREGLEDAGYGRGLVSVDYRWTDNSFNHLLLSAIDLVIADVDVIVTGTFDGIRAAKAATSSIPIVFFGDRHVVAAGLMENSDRPSERLAGIVIPSEGDLERFELLIKLVPPVSVIALVVNPNCEAAETQIQEVQKSARLAGIQVKVLKANTDNDLEIDLAEPADQHVTGLLVGTDLFFDTWRDRLVSLAARYATPAVYGWREFAEIGGLISYGPSRTAIWRQAGVYAGKILQGVKPADLPVQKPKRFELVVNLKTAKMLGLTLPHSILARADEVIE